ncbi:MAG TPA: bifunctional DNA-formamidopyrimidine glycosylase/DNA-(apurinic or apyrimidinic site) lyase [Gammaproteobacteria bacterium]|nr:bifunctional DNA-formamidopyrimidine glycosylase/DNA-(apurinic or apyrimidinic site) lyase [Gammaproteobacteria bacterium]
MPELPEVETTLRGIKPWICGHIVQQVQIHNRHLRWPVPDSLAKILTGQRLQELRRRGKYLLFDFPPGTMLVHLGMSGSLRLTESTAPLRKHDHLQWTFENGSSLRLEDPRRFGCVLFTTDPFSHPLLKSLGPEPFSSTFNGNWLYQQAARRRVAVKILIMDHRVVTGVGNIYACEALFNAGIDPRRPCNRISEQRYQRLAMVICSTLEQAIRAGGTTLRDFHQADGRPGYFTQLLQVYGRNQQACLCCEQPIRQVVIGQRSSYYCPGCQK